jgi:hypothetical protein
MKLTTEVIQELLAYNPETGIFTWRALDWFWFSTEGSYKRWNTLFAGKEAGCIYTNAWGYPRLKIKLLGKLRSASRLAFLWMDEPLPEQVDHLDRDSLNNRWLNLAPSNSAENSKNRSMRPNNTSGVCGVYWNKPAGPWRAQVQVGGKCKNLGYFDNIDDAAAVVSRFRAANGFSDGHGQLPRRVR